MKMLICGGSGFIGHHLIEFLLDQGNEVVILDRVKPKISSPRVHSYQVDLLKPELLKKQWFEGVDAVVNLSGKDIFTFWNKKTKKEIWDSRVRVNKNLIDFISVLPEKPDVFVSASAVGYYGDRGETDIDESSHRGEGFLAELCEAWESEARRAEELGLRSVQVRTAPVLYETGGILKRILRSFRFGFSFTFGPGTQWFSWIHMDDLVHIYHFAITEETLSGPVNASAPYPVRSRDFINHLREFKKALVIPLPVWMLKLFLQETADVLLFSQKMIPAKLLKMHFQFLYPRLSGEWSEEGSKKSEKGRVKRVTSSYDSNYLIDHSL